MSDERKIDRSLQLRSLEALRDGYPMWVDMGQLPDADHPELVANLWYLRELGLIEAKDNPTQQDATAIYSPRITAEGLDFLEDDGGVSAMLRTVTVKFHPDDLRALLVGRVDSSELPAAEKSRLMHAIRSVPSKVLQGFLDRFVREAVVRSPDVLQQLETWANQVS